MRRGLSGLGQRLTAFGSTLADTFLRDNKVIPPVLALLALLVFAWIVAGIFVGGSDDDQASKREELAQSEDAAEGQDTLAPEVENRNVESYAAYESKDPFRQIVPPAGEATTATAPPTEDTTGGTGAGGNGAASPSPGGGGGGVGPTDSDGDGLPDQREARLGLNPNNPDTDGDTIPDGADSDAGGRGGGTGGAGGGGGDRGAGGGGGLFDSGGDLLLP